MLARLTDERAQLAEEVDSLTSVRSEVVLFGTEREVELHYVRAAKLNARHRRVAAQIAAVEAERSLASARQMDDPNQPHVLSLPYGATPAPLQDG